MSQAGSQLKKLIQDELRKIRTKLESKEILSEVATNIIEIIQVRTREGYGVDKPEGRHEKLTPLADSTIAERKRLKKKGKLHKDTSPEKSNLTRTGSMLDNLRAESRKGKITIRGGTPEDSEKAYHAHTSGRPFLFLSASEGEQLAKRLKAFVAKILNR